MNDRQKHIARLTVNVEIISDKGFDPNEIPDHLDSMNAIVELPMACVTVTSGHSIEILEEVEVDEE